MKREEYLKIIADSLGILVYQVKMRNTINLYDINIIAEDFYKDLLNIVYDYNLYNLNTVDKNAPSIDLADDKEKLSIQITSDNTSTKIKKTIEKFIEKKQYQKYDKLKVLILTEKKNYRTKFDTKNLVEFDSNKDVWDYTDLMKDIRGLSDTKLKQVSEFLDTQVNNNIAEITRIQASEVETIIGLIEFLSSNKKPVKAKKTIVDPDRKINKRFKDHSEFLKELYMKLVSLYESAVNEANITMGLDEVSEMLIGTYLMDISDTYLELANDDPKIALENLTVFFADELSKSGKKYDKMAIKYYLISQTIRCNVFPIIEGV